MNNAYMILDLQYGSTGKGLLAGYLAETYKPDVVVTAWAPNAGHTYINSDDKKFVHCMLANGIVSPALNYILLGPGSVINPELLMDEVMKNMELLKGKNIVIHPHAAVVTSEHRDIEQRNVKIGSTMKGTGAAVIQKIERDPDNMNIAKEAFPVEITDRIRSMGVQLFISDKYYHHAIDTAQLIQIEGAQGYSLSIHHSFYPFCTSRDVTPAQVMADCAIPFNIVPEVYGTLRTYPIRVANRYDDDGKMIGHSGPCFDDQHEITWGDVGVAPELTTVTKLPRRVFTFSYEQLKVSIRQCNPSKLFLNFANYLSYDDLLTMIKTIESIGGVELGWVGTGPTFDDVHTGLASVKMAMRGE